MKSEYQAAYSAGLRVGALRAFDEVIGYIEEAFGDSDGTAGGVAEHLIEEIGSWFKDGEVAWLFESIPNPKCEGDAK